MIVFCLFGPFFCFFFEVPTFFLNCWIVYFAGLLLNFWYCVFVLILFETIAAFRSGPVRSIPGLFNDTNQLQYANKPPCEDVSKSKSFYQQNILRGENGGNHFQLTNIMEHTSRHGHNCPWKAFSKNIEHFKKSNHVNLLFLKYVYSGVEFNVWNWTKKMNSKPISLTFAGLSLWWFLFGHDLSAQSSKLVSKQTTGSGPTCQWESPVRGIIIAGLCYSIKLVQHIMP